MSSRTSRSGKRLRRRDALHGWSMHFGPNMTPMVDVVMVILVFFMASAAFIGTDWFLRTAPVVEGGRKSTGSGAKPTDLQQVVNVSLDVGANGRTVGSMLELNNVPLETLLARIAAMPKGKQTEELRVIVRPSQAVAYSDVVRVHAAFHSVGVNQVGLGTKQGAAGAPPAAAPAAPR